MLHAEAHERLTDLALEPARLASLETDASAGSDELRSHLAGCERCRADVAAWRRAWAGLGAARAAGDPMPQPIRAPESLRARTLAAAFGSAEEEASPRATGATGASANVASTHEAARPAPAGTGDAHAADTPAQITQMPPASRRSALRWAPWLAVAAALILALGAGGLAWDRATQLQRAQAANAELAEVASSFDRVLADPVHWVAPLRTTDGQAGGTLAWSQTQLVVVTTVLPAPSDGRSYVCWVERGGTRTRLGAMDFTGSTGYWVGSMAGWADDFAPGARFGVSLTAGGGETVPVLVGSL